MSKVVKLVSDDLFLIFFLHNLFLIFFNIFMFYQNIFQFFFRGHMRDVKILKYDFISRVVFIEFFFLFFIYFK